ncbi:cbb3-type cytochrome c oxidase subunit 3 [Microvirga brassicacearum]|uniref:Cbb3-type cytochrome c oxidase subunit 3 n=1 Tax=Microvirga brassicacearum TaxID=2580413 RepID=A0A5N3PAS1_9HYPH|nr:cbb3-type cytochrome c oxidase subunit 3 [Microvirga brassicacearum]KAB0266848.1 cbb3-type cytochrome c oxidase subunit 3 [Microvirga brassicacearum]
MDIDHNIAVVVAKSFGLFYLIALSIGVLVYVYWPSNGKRFDDAAKNVIHDEDAPWH